MWSKLFSPTCLTAFSECGNREIPNQPVLPNLPSQFGCITIITLNIWTDGPVTQIRQRLTVQGIHCLPLIQHFSGTSTGSQTDDIQFTDKLIGYLGVPINI